MATPPTIRALLDDPVYRAYMKTVPTIAPPLDHGQPWQLWAHTERNTWLTARYETYRGAWPKFIELVRAHPDVAMTSRRVFFAPPGEWYRVKVRKPRKPTPTDPATTHVVIETRWRQLFFWPQGFHWCGRCRRPSVWRPLSPKHHALRDRPAMTTEDNERCHYCGIRWIATPAVDQMVRVS